MLDSLIYLIIPISILLMSYILGNDKFHKFLQKQSEKLIIKNRKNNV